MKLNELLHTRLNKYGKLTFKKRVLINIILVLSNFESML